MSRFAHDNPDDPEGAWDALVDRADLDRKAARENGDPQPRWIFWPTLADDILKASRALYPEARIPETAMPEFFDLTTTIQLTKAELELLVRLSDVWYSHDERDTYACVRSKLLRALGRLNRPERTP